MNEDGSMARRDDLERFAKEHELKIGTIADLIHYRLVNEKTVECIDERRVKTIFGEFILKTYLDNILNEKHFAMVMGNVEQEDAPLVRVHVNRSARDILSIESKSDYKAWSFSNALERVAKEGCGAVVLLYYPETGDEISKNIKTILDPNAHTSQAPEDVVYHQIGTGSQILMDLGIRKMRLMSAPFKFTAISGFDLQVVEHVAVE
jgi:3,4-dihydroxy 2-butanone 4-phosphate synthase/GTP cyclohydrolase II